MIYLATPNHESVVNSCRKQKNDNTDFDRLVNNSVKEIKKEGYVYVYSLEQALEIYKKTPCTLEQIDKGVYILKRCY